MILPGIPIKPSEVYLFKTEPVTSEAIDAINLLLKQHVEDGRPIKLAQNTVMQALTATMSSDTVARRVTRALSMARGLPLAYSEHWDVVPDTLFSVVHGNYYIVFTPKKL